MEGAPFNVGIPHATRSLGVVIRRRDPEPPSVLSNTAALSSVQSAKTGNMRIVQSAAGKKHSRSRRQSPIFLHGAQRRQAEELERVQMREDAFADFGFDDCAAPPRQKAKPNIYDKRTGKLNPHFFDGSDAFERAQRPASGPSTAAALLDRPPFIPVSRRVQAPTHKKLAPSTASPRASPTVIALRRSAALKPARGPPPREPPDQFGIWGVSYLGRRGGRIATRASGGLSDDAYQRTAVAIQESIDRAKQAMEPSPLMELQQRQCCVRISIAHSRVARTWRVPWRVQIHYELEDGKVRGAGEGEGEAEVDDEVEEAVEAMEAVADVEDVDNRPRPRRAETPELDEIIAARKHRIMTMRANLVAGPSSAC